MKKLMEPILKSIGNSGAGDKVEAKGHIRRNLDRGDKRSGQGKLRVSSCCSVLVKGKYHFIFGLTLKGIVPQFVPYRSVFVQKSTVKTH